MNSSIKTREGRKMRLFRENFMAWAKGLKIHFHRNLAESPGVSM
jgi:hypothetical protein